MTQTQQVADHLKRHNAITPMEALRRYGIFRLAARINELRKARISIVTTMVTRGGKTYARYVVG
ncbi:MAG TPA: helix-turn-helix domain-containing protein [Acidobacteriaceae bacterium]|jgi:hypothetical protein